MNKHITILCQIFYPEMISTGQIMTELAIKLVEKGVNVDVIAGYPSILKGQNSCSADIKYKGINIKRPRCTSFPKSSFLGKVLNQITFSLSTFVMLLKDSSKSPLLVLTDPPFLIWIIWLINIIKRRPFFYLFFDLYPETVINNNLIKSGGFIDHLWTYLNSLGIKRASKVICIGRCMKKRIEQKYDLGGFDKLIHIPVWCDDELISQIEDQPHNLINKFDLEDKFVVGYSGNMGRFHDMDTILSAVKELKDHPQIRFLFVGEGYQKKKCQEYIKNHKCGNCYFSTYVSKDSLSALLQSFHVGLACLLPDQTGCSVPSKTYGIMAAKVPVIAVMGSDSEISLMLKESGCGFTVEPGNPKVLSEKILKLYHDKKLNEEMGTKGQKLIQEKYQLNTIANQYKKLLTTIS